MRLSSASILTLTAALIPFATLIAPLSMAPLAAIAIAANLVVRLRDRQGVAIFRTAAALLLLFILGWAALSLLWSVEPVRGLRTVAKLAFIFAGGVLLIDSARQLTADERRRCGTVLMTGTALSIVYLGIEIFTGGGLRGTVRDAFAMPKFEPFMLNRPVTIMVLMIWPALFCVRERFGIKSVWPALALAFALLAPAESGTALLGLGIGACALVLHSLQPFTTFVRTAATTVAVVCILGLPSLAGLSQRIDSWNTDSTTQNSIVHRLYIWDYAATRSLERPVTGWGIEASRDLGGSEKASPKLRAESMVDFLKRVFGTMKLPLHPHSAGLQVWLELGLIGAFLAAAFVGLMLWRTGDRRRWGAAAPFLFALTATVFSTASSGFGIWQSWWMSALWLAAAMGAAVAPSREDD